MEAQLENRAAQEEEKLALTSIYTEDFLTEETGNDGGFAFVVRFSVGVSEEDLPRTTVVVKIHLPPAYPKSEPPVYEMKEAYGEPSWITNEHRSVVKEELQGQFDATAVDGGEHGVLLFEWIEWLREWLESSWRAYLDQHDELVWRYRSEQQKELAISMPDVPTSKNYGSIDELAEPEASVRKFVLVTADLPPVYHSREPLIDRKSVFVAHAAPVSSVEEVVQVKRYLLSNPKIAKATHNILAYRIVQARTSKGKHSIDGEVILSDCDDDGESAAAGRLLHLLEVCKCRNVVVIVSRWYGGTLLGPDRFKHINNVARELLHEHGFIP